jgi:hypothetical protein
MACPEKHFRCATTISTSQLLDILPNFTNWNICTFAPHAY